MSSAHGELPLSSASAQLVQPDDGEAEEAGGSERETVEAPPLHTSSPEPLKKKGETYKTSPAIKLSSNLDH